MLEETGAAVDLLISKKQNIRNSDCRWADIWFLDDTQNESNIGCGYRTLIVSEILMPATT
jgi:hypothetical protein